MSKIYSENNSQIKIKVGESFKISLESNLTTGYSWTAEYDLSLFSQIGSSFESASNAVGAGGKEVFEFQAKKAEDTTITMKLKRPSASEVLKTLPFNVQISE